MAKKKKWDGKDRRTTATVLIASDNEAANELLGRVLDARSFRVLTAVNAETAIGRTIDHLPRAAILDLSAKGVGASMQVLDALRQHDDARVRACRVIVVAQTAANRTFSFQSGADGFILRPYHVKDLVRVLVDVLAVPPDARAKHRRAMIDAAV